MAGCFAELCVFWGSQSQAPFPSNDLKISEVRTPRQTSPTPRLQALKSMIFQSTQLQSSLGRRLQKVTVSLEALEEEKGILLGHLHEKQQQLQVARGRLNLRKQRPQREAVRDPAEEALMGELDHLKNATQSLCRKLDSIEEEQRRLQQLRVSIERDLGAKTASLEVDKKALDLDLDTVSVVSRSTTQSNLDRALAPLFHHSALRDRPNGVAAASKDWAAGHGRMAARSITPHQRTPTPSR